MEFITVYTTAGTQFMADMIAKRLLTERLVACVNMNVEAEHVGGLPVVKPKGPVRSLYHWEGEVQESFEFALMCKTRRDLFDEVTAVIREVHAYETPCVIAWPIVEIEENYAAWILAETKSAS